MIEIRCYAWDWGPADWSVHFTFPNTLEQAQEMLYRWNHVGEIGADI